MSGASPAPAYATELGDSIASLLASGEAWAEPAAAPRGPEPASTVRPGTVTGPVPARARVSLGFRDGTTTCLDPGSEQAAALEELALLLSLRD